MTLIARAIARAIAPEDAIATVSEPSIQPRIRPSLILIANGAQKLNRISKLQCLERATRSTVRHQALL